MLSNFDEFLQLHKWILIATLAGTLSIIIGLNIAAFLHALKGTKHPFPMAMSVAVILNCLLYVPYCLKFFEDAQSIAKLWFYLSYATLAIIHWVLAHRYHSATSEIPFIMYGRPIPRGLVIRNQVFFWIVTLLIAASSAYIFCADYTWKVVFFTISVTLIVLISVVMYIALFRMKKTIESMPRLKQHLNVAKMFNHSLAFIFYMGTWILFTSKAIYTNKNENQYASWFIMTLAGLASFVMFFLIIWSLGTKHKLRTFSY